MCACYGGPTAQPALVCWHACCRLALLLGAEAPLLGSREELEAWLLLRPAAEQWSRPHCHGAVPEGLDSSWQSPSSEGRRGTDPGHRGRAHSTVCSPRKGICKASVPVRSQNVARVPAAPG